MPLAPDAGIPARVAVPSLLSTRVTPTGNVPVLVTAAIGDPVVVTLKDPAAPAVKVAEAAEVIAGAVRMGPPCRVTSS